MLLDFTLSTLSTDDVFVLTQLQEKNLHMKNTYCAFLGLNKVFDHVLYSALW